MLVRKLLNLVEHMRCLVFRGHSGIPFVDSRGLQPLVWPFGRSPAERDGFLDDNVDTRPSLSQVVVGHGSKLFLRQGACELVIRAAIWCNRGNLGEDRFAVLGHFIEAAAVDLIFQEAKRAGTEAVFR